MWGRGSRLTAPATATASAGAPALLPGAQVGGMVTAMASDARRLFVARGSRVELHLAGAVDLTTPHGLSPPQAEAPTALAIDRDVLWALSGAPGGHGMLRAFDVHDPQAIHVLAELPQRAAGAHLAVSAGRAWLATGGGALDCVDVSVPWRPTRRGRVPFPGLVRDLAPVADGVWALVGPPEDDGTVAPSERVASLWHVTAPGAGAPTATQLLTLPSGSKAAALFEGWLVVAGFSHGLTLYDPERGFAEVGGARPRRLPAGVASDLVLAGDHAWLSSSAGLVAFGGLRAGRPIFLEELGRRTRTETLPVARLATSGDDLWAVEGMDRAGRVWRVPGGSSGAVSPARLDPSVLALRASAVDGEEVWSVDGDGAVLRWPGLVDGPARRPDPRPVAELGTPLHDVTVDARTGTRYLVGEGGVYAIAPRTQEPRAVLEDGEDAPKRTYHEAWAEDGWLLLRLGRSALMVDDETPGAGGPFTLAGRARTVALEGRRVWLGDLGTITAHTLEHGSAPAPATPPQSRARALLRALAPSAPFLALLDASGLLSIDDWTDRHAPRVVGVTDLGASNEARLVWKGERLWAAWSEAGAPFVLTLALIDLSDPSAPTELARRTLTHGGASLDMDASAAMPDFDLAATEDLALLTLHGATTTWRLDTPPPTPRPWTPVARAYVPLVTR